jgi:hypothetical protein
MLKPKIAVAPINWDIVRTSFQLPNDKASGLSKIPALPKQAEVRAVAERTDLGVLNRAMGRIFPNIALSPVPVLLPVASYEYVHDLAAYGPKGLKASSAYLSGYSASKFFLPGPAGYDAAFLIRPSKVSTLSDLQVRGLVEVQISGSSVIYTLEFLSPPAGEIVPDLQRDFPGLRRVLHEGYLRYTFVRYGAPYIVSLQCTKRVSCDDADRIGRHFLSSLQLAGGTPGPARSAAVDMPLERPPKISKNFTYLSPGNLIPQSGYQSAGGNPDRTVYATIRFPIAQTPAYANSQEFMNGGNCYGTGRVPETSTKNGAYHCKVNDKPLRYFEGDPENFSYPWRDNFCEMRDWLVGQCPHGHGHQGQDIRPPSCKPHHKNSEKCEPYQHDALAVRDSYVLRSKEQQALFLIVNEPNEHIRFRYLHMSPTRMDADGLITGRRLREGAVAGKVGNYLDTENGTTYHLHFDIQVPTKDGWVWVSPYMTLVAAYERAIGARGVEIKRSAEPQASANLRTP